MSETVNMNIQEENDFQKIFEQIRRNYYLFIIGVVVALGVAFGVNYLMVPVYKVSSSIRIKQNPQTQKMGDFINYSLFGTNQNLQDELLVFQSSPVIIQTIKNLDLPVTYYRKKGFQYIDAYKNVPFKVMYLHNHLQPIGARFEVSFVGGKNFHIQGEGKKVAFYNYELDQFKGEAENWKFDKTATSGQLIETPEMSFMIQMDSSMSHLLTAEKNYYFQFSDVPSLTDGLIGNLVFDVVDKKANVIEVSIKTTSKEKGLDIISGLTDVYANQNLEKKNNLAKMTIEYIDKQIGEISDSLSRTEQSLQSFRSTNQVLNVTEQSSGITTQYRDLENQKAEIVTKKKYYDYVLDYLSKNDDFTNIIVPSSLGIQDQLLNGMMSELITSQAQKSSLIENNQEKNPAVKKLSIKIENLKKTISENIAYVLKTTEITLDEINKRIGKIEAEISKMPNTERQLTGIERKFRLNDAIYNFLMEKRAEANITKASNMPDNEIVEPARSKSAPVSPNKRMNYMIAFALGLLVPFFYLQLKSAVNNKLEGSDQIEKITEVPVLGKILHNRKKTSNVVFEFPSSNIAESYRALRTNLEYYVRGGHKKVILVTSSLEGEGKSFNALNIAMSYAQLDRRVMLLDFDLRKKKTYFNENGENLVGMTSYLINKATLEDIIIHSPHPKMDYIPSGPIPPNPVELIGLEKTEKLISQLKGVYDYIIIDTPPLAQVTDAYLLIEQADVKVIITRSNYTLKNVFALVMKDLEHKGIKNTCIVLNDNRSYRDQYGYGYGYYSKGKSKKA